jgi:hypothetical protein
MMERAPPPRLFGIPATRADMVAVIRRGPSDWCHVGRWDVEKLNYEPGSWFRGRLFPQRCDLSADGRWFAYMAFKENAIELSHSYLAVSRLPWLKALAAWRLGDTYARGFHFVNETSDLSVGDPDVGHVPHSLFGLQWTEPAQFAVERRRGWVEDETSPPRGERDHWDEKRRGVRMQKRQPRRREVMILSVEGRYAAFREGAREGDDWHWYPAGERGVTYALSQADEIVVLEDVQWADWSRFGHLLVATLAGRLQVRQLKGLDDFSILFEANLGRIVPDPQKPPDIAGQW